MSLKLKLALVRTLTLVDEEKLAAKVLQILRRARRMHLI